VRRTPALLTAVIATAGLAGCGGATDQTAQVRATVVAYGNAVAAKDYSTICRKLFAPNLLADLSSRVLPCKTALSRAFGGVLKPTLTVGTVKVTGQSALASVHTTAANQSPDDTTIGLVEVGKTWRIASLTGPASSSG
jgi:hypothetical protein